MKRMGLSLRIRNQNEHAVFSLKKVIFPDQLVN
jgi:hypothetical protein